MAYIQEIFIWILMMIVLAAWLMATYYLVQAGKERAVYKHGDGILWFLGICLTPVFFALYIIVMSLPSSRETRSDEVKGTLSSADLPPV